MKDTEDYLIRCSDALKAVDERHEELLHHPEYRKKHCQIDLLGIKKHILAIPPVENKGEWIYKDFDEETGIRNSYFCSKCGCPQSQVYINFCGNCGADLRGAE